MSDWLAHDSEDNFEEDHEKRYYLDPAVLQVSVSTLGLRAPVCVDAAESIATSIDRLRERKIGCVLVTSDERLVGIFTERDVVQRVFGTNVDPGRTPVCEVMTPDPETLAADAPMTLALNRMSFGGFRHLPVVSGDNRPTGIISVKDIVDYLVEFFPREVLNLPPKPGLDVPRAREGA